jgi:CMP-N,N'-diacetyllegionaminic acid synthase
MTDLLIVVPVRGGSKRLPGKHTRLLAGRDLLERTRDAIAEAGLEGPVLLTTDDSAIAERGRALGWWVPFLRPASLAGDDVPSLPVLLHALEWNRREVGADPATVALLQTTSPLRGGAVLREAVTLLEERADAQAVLGVRRLGFGQDRVFRREPSGLLSALSDDQGSPDLFVPNGALYLIRSSALRTYETLFPPITLPLEMDAVSSIDIDTESDWRLARALLNDSGADASLDPTELDR